MIFIWIVRDFMIEMSGKKKISTCSNVLFLPPNSRKFILIKLQRRSSLNRTLRSNRQRPCRIDNYDGWLRNPRIRPIKLVRFVNYRPQLLDNPSFIRGGHRYGRIQFQQKHREILSVTEHDGLTNLLMTSNGMLHDFGITHLAICESNSIICSPLELPKFWLGGVGAE